MTPLTGSRDQRALAGHDEANRVAVGIHDHDPGRAGGCHEARAGRVDRLARADRVGSIENGPPSNSGAAGTPVGGAPSSRVMAAGVERLPAGSATVYVTGAGVSL